MPDLEFSAILAAVPPRDRSDQYKILATLYFLGAHREPVTTTAVNELLKLHLPRASDRPSNTTTSLRAYTSLVELTGPEIPYRWRLTQKGLERLRALSGLSLVTHPPESEFQTDVGFVCALQHPEFAALMRACGGEERWVEAGGAQYCHVFRSIDLMTTSGRQLKVVGTVSTSMGLTAAAIATTHLVLQFKPRLVVMVGIAAGTQSKTRRFGDVLVADPSIDYNSGKIVMEKGVRKFEPDPYPIGLNPRLRTILHKYRTTHSVFA